MTFYKWMVGAFLTVIMLAALATNAFLFNARAFQYNLAQIAPQTNGIVSIRALAAADEQITQISNRTAAQRGERAQIEEAIATVNVAVQDNQAAIGQGMIDLARAVAAAEDRMGMQSAEAASALDKDALEARAEAIMVSPAAVTAQAQALSVRQISARLRELDDRTVQLQNQLRDLQTRQRQVGGSLAESDGAIIALKRSVVGDQYELYDRVKSETDALQRASPYGIGSSFVSAHPAFLSTLLVLLMGLLGALLYLFPAYMSRTNPQVSFAEIIVRMVFGMVTALAFYIVANATLAGLSFVPGQSESSNAALLNPFAVGLVGIIAGVTADDIAKWIQRRGNEILGGRPGEAPPAVSTTQSQDPGFTGINPHGGPPPV
ncbi:MAG: hypothetical protein JNJ73_18020 [Hyphomonadaceae bacterium]|nr:hypothetical protein [Hyphomonadaceae bacterium]